MKSKQAFGIRTYVGIGLGLAGVVSSFCLLVGTASKTNKAGRLEEAITSTQPADNRANDSSGLQEKLRLQVIPLTTEPAPEMEVITRDIGALINEELAVAEIKEEGTSSLNTARLLDITRISDSCYFIPYGQGLSLSYNSQMALVSIGDSVYFANFLTESLKPVPIKKPYGISPNGTKAWTFDNGSLIMVSLKTGEAIKIMQPGYVYRNPCFSGDSSRMGFFVDVDGFIHLCIANLDAKTMVKVPVSTAGKKTGHYSYPNLQLNKNGTVACFGNSDDQRIYRMDIGNMTVTTIGAKSSMNAGTKPAAISQIALGDDDTIMYLWNNSLYMRTQQGMFRIKGDERLSAGLRDVDNFFMTHNGNGRSSLVYSSNENAYTLYPYPAGSIRLLKEPVLNQGFGSATAAPVTFSRGGHSFEDISVATRGWRAFSGLTGCSILPFAQVPVKGLFVSSSDAAMPNSLAAR